MAVLIALIAVNVLVSIAGFRALGGEAGGAEHFVFIPNRFARGENGLGMLLAHFSHASVMHLLLNMFTLFSFAGPVIAALGPAKLLAIYAASGLGSDLVVFALWKDDPAYRCLGASGSVFGIMTAAIVLDPTTSVAFVFAPVPIPGPIFMLGYALISVFLIMRRHRGGISHEGHLGGAIVGMAVTALLAPRGLGPLLRWFGQWQ